VTTLNVIVRPWRGGWELEVDSEHITQVRKLANARQQVVDYLRTLDPDTDVTRDSVNLVPDLGVLGDDLAAARVATREAARMQAEAAEQTRELVARLRAEHFSGSDIAELLGDSAGRVSQLLNK